MMRCVCLQQGTASTYVLQRMERRPVTTGSLAECVALPVMTAGSLLKQYHHILYGAVERQEYGYHPCAGQIAQVNTIFFAK